MCIHYLFTVQTTVSEVDGKLVQTFAGKEDEKITREIVDGQLVEVIILLFLKFFNRLKY